MLKDSSAPLGCIATSGEMGVAGLNCFLLQLSLCPLVTAMHCGGHQVGYMFLGEVALGKEHHITTDDPSLKSPPPGFDSVIARGQTEPGEPQTLGRSAVGLT